MELKYEERSEMKRNSDLDKLKSRFLGFVSLLKETKGEIEESVSKMLSDGDNENSKIEDIKPDCVAIPTETKEVEVQTNSSKNYSTCYEYESYANMSSVETSSNNYDYSELNSEQQSSKRKKKRRKSTNVEKENLKVSKKKDPCQAHVKSCPPTIHSSNILVTDVKHKTLRQSKRIALIKEKSDAMMTALGRQSNARMAEIQRQLDVRMAEIQRQSDVRMAEIQRQLDIRMAEIQRQSDVRMAEIMKNSDSNQTAIKNETGAQITAMLTDLQTHASSLDKVIKSFKCIVNIKTNCIAKAEFMKLGHSIPKNIVLETTKCIESLYIENHPKEPEPSYESIIKFFIELSSKTSKLSYLDGAPFVVGKLKSFYSKISKSVVQSENTDVLHTQTVALTLIWGAMMIALLKKSGTEPNASVKSLISRCSISVGVILLQVAHRELPYWKYILIIYKAYAWVGDFCKDNPTLYKILFPRIKIDTMKFPNWHKTLRNHIDKSDAKDESIGMAINRSYTFRVGDSFVRGIRFNPNSNEVLYDFINYLHPIPTDEDIKRLFQLYIYDHIY